MGCICLSLINAINFDVLKCLQIVCGFAYILMNLISLYHSLLATSIFIHMNDTAQGERVTVYAYSVLKEQPELQR